jgi:hypothetical protein
LSPGAVPWRARIWQGVDPCHDRAGRCLPAAMFPGPVVGILLYLIFCRIGQGLLVIEHRAFFVVIAGPLSSRATVA